MALDKIESEQCQTMTSAFVLHTALRSLDYTTIIQKRNEHTDNDYQSLNARNNYGSNQDRKPLA